MLVLAVVATTVVPSSVGVLATRGPLPIRCAVGAVVGTSVVGVGAVLGAFVGGAVPGAIAALSVLGVLGWRRPLELGDRPPSTIALVLVAAVLAVGVALLVLAVQRPVARWDAWAIWSMKAKALASWGSFSNPVFLDPTYGFTHQDYPPLLPAWQALGFMIGGDLTASWVTQVQLTWLWTTGAAASIVIADRWGLLAGLLPFAWALSPAVLGQSLWGFADVPMALMLIVGIALLASAGSSRTALYAGIVLGAAGLTKGEGFLLAMLAIVPFLTRRHSWKWAATAGGFTLAAQLPWQVFTRLHALGNDVIRSETLRPARLMEVAPPRFEAVFRGVGSQIADVTEWGALVVAIAVALMIGRPAWRLTAATFLGFALFIGVYVITPQDVEHHMSRSVHRVVVAPMGLAALTGAMVLRDRSGTLGEPHQSTN